ncbi:MAG: glycosyltransferase family 4 protein [Anaerolineales bacterium]|nr:glycosyltransferase family 4 protein [Anaerolineales bacterium]
MDQLATLSQELIHIATLHDGPAPAGAIPYQNPKITVKTVQPTGGKSWKDKIGILTTSPRYLQLMAQEISLADMVHVRCPANISLLALFYLSSRKNPAYRWFKYAGNWQPPSTDATSYRLQRWWLKHNWARGQVTVNGEWPEQPTHIHSFLNPSLTLEEYGEAKEAARRKELALPLQLIFVGRVETAKGIGRALEIVAELECEACLHVIGDGPEKSRFQAQAQALGIGDQVIFHGWVSREQISTYYEQAHFILLPSEASEGWPKVLSEAMAYGAVPIASNISSIPQILGKFGVGKAIPPVFTNRFADAIRQYLADPTQWHAESQAGSEAAFHFTYRAYLEAVRELITRMGN